MMRPPVDLVKSELRQRDLHDVDENSPYSQLEETPLEPMHTYICVRW